MQFNSGQFLIFFPLVTLFYFVIPKKVKYLWLLAASYFFYMCWNVKYAALIFISTISTWASALLLSKVNKKKLVLALCIVINLAILFFFKYFDFFLDNINALLSGMGISVIQNPFSLVLPVGISFYTFQALGYIIDVYRGDVEAEKNPFRYALFVSFFPQLVAGPIERSKNLLSQMQRIEDLCKIDFRRIVNGLVYMMYGLFLKMVLADRLSTVVNVVFNDYTYFGGIELVVAAIAFSFQIYMDFSSYSIIAIGAAQVLGFTLMENFDTPYFAVSVKDFWRRWHISLSTWMRDYIYIPLGGNRKGEFRKNLNLMITFLVSGLWHGANWTYVVWGGYHALMQIIGSYTLKLRKKVFPAIGLKLESISYKFFSGLVTFVLVTIGWVFFRAESISKALDYILRIFTRWNPWSLDTVVDGTFGLDIYEWGILMIGMLIVLVVAIIKKTTGMRIDAFLESQGGLLICLFVILMFILIYVYGIYGTYYEKSQFIYFQF